MSSAQNLNQEWQNWVNENLARRCAPADIYNIMRDNGFGIETIKNMMGKAYPIGIEHDDPNAPIDYQALADAPLCKNNPNLIVQRFNSDLIQLYTIEDFLSPEECQGLINIAEKHLKPSEVTHYNGDDYFRTSETCDFLQTNEDLVDHIEEKIAQALGIRLAFSESIQVQRYDVGQEFKAHYDYFEPNTDIYQNFASAQGQRTWTFMVYLNHTPQGGGTRFTEIDHTFYPKQGMAVVWNNLLTDGTPNRYTMHHGMPVEAGKKVIITKWFREKGHGPMFFKDLDEQAVQQESKAVVVTTQNTLKAVLPNIRAIQPAKVGRKNKKRRHKAKRK